MKSTSEQQTYKLYFSNSSNRHIYLSRIRLNTQWKKYNFIAHNTCPFCHFKNETKVHFILKCAKYAWFTAPPCIALAPQTSSKTSIKKDTRQICAKWLYMDQGHVKWISTYFWLYLNLFVKLTDLISLHKCLYSWKSHSTAIMFNNVHL